MTSVWSKPCERAAIADPRSEAAVQVYRGSVLRQVCSHQSGIDRNDVRGRKVISESDLEWHSLLSHNHSAQMCRHSRTVKAKRVERVESPERCEVWEIRMQTIRELPDIHGSIKRDVKKKVLPRPE